MQPHNFNRNCSAPACKRPRSFRHGGLHAWSLSALNGAVSSEQLQGAACRCLGWACHGTLHTISKGLTIFRSWVSRNDIAKLRKAAPLHQGPQSLQLCSPFLQTLQPVAIQRHSLLQRVPLAATPLQLATKPFRIENSTHRLPQAPNPLTYLLDFWGIYQDATSSKCLTYRRYHNWFSAIFILCMYIPSNIHKFVHGYLYTYIYIYVSTYVRMHA